MRTVRESMRVKILELEADYKPPTPVKDYGRGKRGQITNRQLGSYQVNSVSLNKVYSVDLNPQSMDDVKWLHVNNLVSDYDQIKNLIVMMGAQGPSSYADHIGTSLEDAI